MSLQDAANEVDVAGTREDTKALAYENVFAGVPSILRRRITKDLTNVDLAVTGVPDDREVPRVIDCHVLHRGVSESRVRVEDCSRRVRTWEGDRSARGRYLGRAFRAERGFAPYPDS